MKIRVLGAGGGKSNRYLLPSFLVEDELLLDAGTIIEILKLEELLSIKNILLTHSHLDHVVGLPFLVDYILSVRKDRIPIIVHGIEHTIKTIKESIFNDSLWPNFSKLPTEQNPILIYNIIAVLTTYRISKFEIMAIPTNHTIPSVGYIISDGKSSFVYTGDTGPTENFWKIVFDKIEPNAIIIECTFPNIMTELAKNSGHLTPNLLEKELKQIPPSIPIYIFHIKPGYHNEIQREISNIKRNITILTEDFIIQC